MRIRHMFCRECGICFPSLAAFAQHFRTPRQHIDPREGHTMAQLYHAHPGGAKGCVQPPMGNWVCPYTSKAEADAHRHLSMLDQAAVNVAVQCLSCEGILEGSAFWPLRKSMALHRMNGRCHNARYAWVPMVLADAQ